MTSKEALEKLDNTLCLNSPVINFNIDDEDNIDCKDIDEMIECLETIERDLEVLEAIKDIKDIDLIALLNAKFVYVATFDYWRWNSRDKQQCKKGDVGAIEEKRIEKKCGFSIDFRNKEIVIIECVIFYGIKITKLKFEDYGKIWALTKEELEKVEVEEYDR